MHRSLVFLLIAVFASTASALPSRPRASSPPENSVAATPVDNGKIKLGLEGCGNYRKPKIAKTTEAKAPEPSDFQKAMKKDEKPSTNAAAPQTATPATSPTQNQTPTTNAAAAAAVVPPTRELRSDKTLFTPKSTVAPAGNAVPQTIEAPKIMPNTLAPLAAGTTTPKP